MHLIFKIFLVLITSISFVSAAAGGAGAVAVEPESDWRYLEFYKASKGDQTLYVHGTMHTQNFETIPGAFKEAIDKCSACYTECLAADEGVDLSAYLKTDDDPDVLAFLRSHAVHTMDGKKRNAFELFKEVVSPSKDGKDGEIFERLFNTYQPAVASMCAAEIAFHHNGKYDKTIAARFTKNRKPVGSFETYTDIKDCFIKDLPPSIKDEADLKKFLRDSIAKILVLEKGGKLRCKVYRSGLVGMVCDVSISKGDVDASLHGRTNLWFSRLFSDGRFIKEQNALLTMGVAHLYENDDKPGFLRILYDQGWVLENLGLDGEYTPFNIIEHEKTRPASEEILNEIDLIKKEMAAVKIVKES